MTSNDPRFEGWKAVSLQLQPETSSLIAELRASYAAEGREVSSLSRVVGDAVLQYHSDFFSVRSCPSDADNYMRTEAKHDD